MKQTTIKEINEYKSKSIDPRKEPETVFEMYSVPAYSTGHPEYLSGEQIASNKVIVEKNDILLCKINPRINRVWVVQDESEKQNIASSEWIVIRTKKYNPEYLAWYFQSPKFKQLMVSEVTGIGGSLTRAQPKRIANYPVPNIEREKQDEIVKRLNLLHDSIQKRKEEIQLFDELIKARFVEMFGDPRDNPKMYKKESLGKHADVLVGYPFKSKEYSEKGIPIVGGYNLMQGYIEWEQCKYWPNESGYEKYLLRDNDIVLAMDRPWVGGGFKIARITNDHLPALLIQRTACVRGKDVEQEFLYALLNSEWFAEHCNITGSLVPHISGKDIANYEIILPSKTEQRDYVYFVHQVDKSKFFIFRIQACYNIFIQIDFNSQIF